MQREVHIMENPLIKQKITMLRDKNTETAAFRQLVGEISYLLGCEAGKALPSEACTVQTPLTRTEGSRRKGQIVLAPVLRAGLGMTPAMLSLFPDAQVGLIGMYRDHETLTPREYYCKLPEKLADKHIFVLDPMLATGGSAAAAIESLKQRGAAKISFLCIIAAPEGVDMLCKEHPDTEVYIAALDERLNEQGYILPGLGDAGDRLFGTEGE